MFSSKLFTRFFVATCLSIFCLSFGLGHISAQDSASIEYTITMSEFHFLVDGLEANSVLELEVNQPYTLHFVNAGTFEHEVLIGQNPIEIGEGMHLDFEANLLDDLDVEIAGVMNEADFAIGVAGLIEFELHPTQELSISFTLPEEKIGEWEIACFVYINPEATDENPSPTHYDAAMKIPVNVVAAQE